MTANTIYADANATQAVSLRHMTELQEWLLRVDGNPSSQHAAGREAKVALEDARRDIAAWIGVSDQELIFTSGGTEANNMVLQGLAWRERESEAPRPKVLVSAIEHPAILEPARVLAARGLIDLVEIDVDHLGYASAERFAAAVDDQTKLVCLMLANNETGAIQPLAEVAAAVKAKNPQVHVHTDAVQALGKISLECLQDAQIDSAAFSAHKVGAFKGVGALYLRRGCQLSQLTSGGGQERRRRPGTENLPGILSFALRAREIQQRGLNSYGTEVGQVRDAIVEELAGVDGFELHGDPGRTLPNTIHFHVKGVTSDDLILNLDLGGVQCSSGSACSSGAGRPSHVMTAMGYSDQDALGSVRLSLPDHPDPAAASRIGEIVRKAVERIRK